MAEFEMLHDVLSMKEHVNCRNFRIDSDNGFCYKEIKAGDSVGFESMDNNYLFFFLDGDYSIVRSGFRRTVFHKDEMIVIPKSVEFHGEALTDCKMVTMGFEHVSSGCDKFVLQQYEPYCQTVRYEFKATPVRYPITAYLDLLVYCLRNGIDCAHLQEMKQKELFIYLYGFYSFEEIGDLFHPLVGNALNFREQMMNSLKSAKTVDDLVEASHLSHSAFYAKFKKEFGITAKDWMLEQLSREILLRIQDPEVTIKDIIYEYDFPSYPAFNRFCQRQYHCTPTELVNYYRDSRANAKSGIK
ncbi:MAG: helix-turn-helix transcriptional regulator [Bacteroidales bacterium]|jgi:AraC-like DNA-binding protein|nr:helix-turn-helix transcriptional regulator [Bacteroidales bacterium]MCI2121993.1 helix-turn-helix transcriptional regulator [Bacteroidales bacterium]MCI2145578.1 helix-turn-helix transcriptional regulator [Bacteroidales bacterium]